MGGSDHHEPFKVPDYKVYDNWRQYPELVQHQERLARLGLKDPWIRNYVWIFDRRNLTQWQLLRKSVFGGFGVGICYAVVGVLLTEGVLWWKQQKRLKAKAVNHSE
ncbi:unnamed protein product [Soboliphyme baturini]|uniref:NADH dehydrogenase [ubiquinone] 1 beta subcomplex subunit 3 n=1 Tax=Soboliphyme baturini TaxID=241478 RepID=A0A183JA14_9BILA|nr:unnamed protein product [Soboliphyme baturini]